MAAPGGAGAQLPKRIIKVRHRHVSEGGREGAHADKRERERAARVPLALSLPALTPPPASPLSLSPQPIPDPIHNESRRPRGY